MKTSVIALAVMMCVGSASFAKESENPNVVLLRLSQDQMQLRADARFDFDLLDNWSNQYKLNLTPYGGIEGTFLTIGCSEKQPVLGKVIQGAWTLVIGATTRGDCVGGLVRATAADGVLRGVWMNVTDGSEHAIEFTPRP